LLLSSCLARLLKTAASLETADTQLQFDAGLTAPKVSSLRNDATIWKNRTAESLIPNVEIAGTGVPLKWTFNKAETHTNKNLVSFVFDATSPHLRLTWEWEARSHFGPIEHQIRIENRASSEVWLPLENSFVFDWETSARGPV
jgi:hypothetical protein